MKILINEKWNYQLLKDADKYSLTVVCRTVRIYKKKIILKKNEIQLYIDTGKKWIDKKLKIFENRNKKASYTRLFVYLIEIVDKIKIKRRHRKLHKKR